MNTLYPIYTLKIIYEEENIEKSIRCGSSITFPEPLENKVIHVLKITKNCVIYKNSAVSKTIEKMPIDDFVSKYLPSCKYQCRKEWVIRTNINAEYIFQGDIVTICSLTNGLDCDKFRYIGIKRGASGTYVMFKRLKKSSNNQDNFLEFGNPDYTGNIPEDNIECIPLFNDYTIFKEHNFSY